MDREQREGALEALAGLLHREGQHVALGSAVLEAAVDGAQKPRGHLGVGVGDELEAVGQQFRLELRIVLDDAVVDDGQSARIGEVRVGVLVGGAAVGGPAGVADAGQGPRQRRGGEFLDQVGQFAGLLAGFDARRREHRHAGGVVSAVFEAPEALHDDVEGTVLRLPIRRVTC